MPNPAGDPKDILKKLAEMDLDSDQTPEEIVAQDQGTQDDESKKKAARAWHDLRGTLKVARGVIEELTKVQEPKPAGEAASQTPASSSDKNAAAQMYLDQLTTRAMQAVGIFDATHRLVQMEVARLYQADMSRAEQTERAKLDGDKVFDSVVSGFKSLDDSDKAVIKTRMSGLSPLDKTNTETIKMFIHTYVGENIDKFSKSKPKGEAPADAAAASGLKARGGVGAGDFSVGSRAPVDTKPATAEEIKGMRALRMPLDRVDLYRKAQAKKEAYVIR